MLVFLALAMILHAGDPFYENGTYLAYAKSMMNDFDLNIINQIPDDKSWLITPKNFHPDFHSSLQNIFIIPLMMLENLLNMVGIKSGTPNLIISFLLNFLSLYFSLKYIKKLCAFFNLELNNHLFLLFVFGSSLFYFSFFTVHSIDLFSIPFISYCLFTHFNYTRNQEKPDLFNYGIALSLLFCLKALNTTLALFLFLSYFINLFKSKNYKHALYFIVFFLSIILATELTNYVKYGAFVNPHISSVIMSDFNILHFIKKIFHNFISPSGLFFINPLLTLGLMGFVYWAITELKRKNLTKIEVIAFLFWVFTTFFHTIALIGNLLEDRYPGRTPLLSLPFLIIGLIFIYNKIQNKQKQLFLSIYLIIWNMFQVFNFAKIDLLDPDLFPGTTYLTLEQSSAASTKYLTKISYNFSFFIDGIVLVLICTVLLSALLYLIEYRPSFKFKQRILSTFILTFVLSMTSLNFYYGPKNGKKLAAEGKLDNATVGNGSEIYLFDYFFDYYKMVEQTISHEDLFKLRDARRKYIETVRKQTLQSSQEFEDICDSLMR